MGAGGGCKGSQHPAAGACVRELAADPQNVASGEEISGGGRAEGKGDGEGERAVLASCDAGMRVSLLRSSVP